MKKKLIEIPEELFKKIEEYPKEESKKYNLGEYIKPIILKDGKPYKPKEDKSQLGLF